MGEKRLKIYEIEKHTGISRNTLTRIYYNRVDAIKLRTLNSLCNFLECKIDDIFEFIPD